MTVQEILEMYLTRGEQERWYYNHYNTSARHSDWLSTYGRSNNDKVVNVNEFVISEAFDWGQTPEGFGYWFSIHERVSNDFIIKKPIKPLKTMNKHKFV